MQTEDTYRLKKVLFNGKTIPIVMQNINGPCPLIGIVNILLLQNRVEIHLDYSMVTYQQLVELLGDLLLNQKPPELKELVDNYNQSVADAIALFPTLQFGLDVNIRFRHITDFEFTRELTVFDLFNIRLVHGWIVPSDDEELVNSVGNLSYNEVVEKLIHLQEHRDDEPSEELEKEKQIERFMNSTASQLSVEGLGQLFEDIEENEFCVFFRNNHFSVLHKREGVLYLLVTDQGYLYQKKIMWELFDSVDGDSHFFAPDFTPYTPEDNTPEGIVANDDMMDDALLAQQLQREEEEAHANAEKDRKEAQEKADHEMALLLQQQEDNGNMRQGNPAQPNSQPQAPAVPQTQPLTTEQLQQLNDYIGESTKPGNCPTQ